MFIVTKNNPYYPSVMYCGTLDEAENVQTDWLMYMASINGAHECKVTIAKVIETRTVRSDY